MWSIIKAILIKFGMLRGLIAVLGSLAAVLPIAIALIKFLGWPIVIALFVLALPLLLVLAIIGFPLIAILSIAGIVMGIAFAVISVGLVLLKFFLFVVLPIWIGWKVVTWMLGRRRDSGEKPATEGAT
jgi:hypothetical protein